MKLQRSILVFFVTCLAATTSHAYIGLKLGAFYNDGSTNFGAGVVLGIPVPVTGLTAEAEVSGYYESTTLVDIVYIQPSVGAAYDFNSLITPDSSLIHPYVRAGFAYGFITYTGGAAISNQNAPGFYTGVGINFRLPIVTVGIEGNYNYINFDGTTSQDYWNTFVSAAIRF